jgi:low affinity Fe/Cu permease
MTEIAANRETDRRLRQRVHRAFARAASTTARAVGHPAAFLLAAGIVTGWGLAGWPLGFSEGWQLWINTGTTIFTFLIVILLQNSQNRHSEAVQLKLDELLRAVDGARVSLADIENLDDEELAHLRAVFERLAGWARRGEVAVAERQAGDAAGS